MHIRSIRLYNQHSVQSRMVCWFCVFHLENCYCLKQYIKFGQNPSFGSRDRVQTSCFWSKFDIQSAGVTWPGFLEKMSLYWKKFFGHVLGCGAGVFGESGSVNQCGTKGKVYGCKLNLNHWQKPALLSSDHNGPLCTSESLAIWNCLACKSNTWINVSM